MKQVLLKINAQILAQLQSIGQRLTKIESTQRKKSTDSAKIKSTSKRGPDTNSRSHCHRHKINCWQMLQSQIQCLAISYKTLLMFLIRWWLWLFQEHYHPTLNELRQDVYIQNQVKKRLKELADSVKTGNCKQKSLRGSPVEVIVPNGPMSTFFLVSRKSEFHMTSCQLPNGWMASAAL